MTATQDSSEIQEFYRDTSVFITGGTGFLGKLVIEKLLRTCPGIKKIYVLCRPKRGQEVAERIAKLSDDKVYDVVRKIDPEFKSKIIAIAGDCTRGNLGISEADKETLIKEINVIFHCAATVRFNEELHSAVPINICGTRDVCRLARGMRQLKAFVHVSTAYSNCVHPHVEEKLYETPFDGDELVRLVETTGKDALNRITPELLGAYPNTYTFTKAVAEDVVRQNSDGMPVGIVRPAIILPTYKEPYAGWCGDMQGATGIVAALYVGLLHNMHTEPNHIAAMVPGDYVANFIIVAAWDIFHIRNGSRKNEGYSGIESRNANEIPVYNYAGAEEQPITWDFFLSSIMKHCEASPTTRALWLPFLIITKYLYFNMMCKYLFYVMPVLIDGFLYCSGKIPSAIKGYKKICTLADSVAYFMLNEWLYGNGNTRSLYRKINDIDKGLFSFNMATMNWNKFMDTYVIGIRVNILKDPLTTIPQAKQKYTLLRVANMILISILAFILYRTIIF